MRIRPVLALACMGCISFSSAAAAAPGAPPFESFADSLMRSQLQRLDIPGAVLVVVRDGRIEFARGYGFADVERRIPVAAERTTFRVASVSKLFTATAVMQLVEQGKLDLHADVNHYLVAFRVPGTYPQPVTLFDLLTHSAGFDESNLARKALQPMDVEPLGDYLARHLPPRVRPPGDLICYSNHGLALAGYLVEVASGIPFERYMKERVFAPLDMAHSSFALVPDSVADLATGYAGTPARPQPRDYTRTIPASMMSASGTDVAHFMIAQLAGGSFAGRAILGREAVAEMQRRQRTQHAWLDGVGLGFWERHQHGERAVWHDGDAAGFSSLLYLLPARHVGWFMAFNSRAGARARREILNALLAREGPPPAPLPPPRPDPRSALLAARIAGTYVDTRHAHTTLEKIAALAQYVTVTANADGALRVDGLRYVPGGQLSYRSEDGDGRLAYRMDGDGNVTHLFESRSIARTYERVPWYASLWLQLVWLLVCVLGALAYVAGTAWRAWFRGSRVPVAGMPRARWVGPILAGVSIANLAFLVGFAACIAGAFGSLEYTIPPALPLLLTLPIASTALTLLALVGIVRAWQATEGAFPKVLLALGVIASLAFIPWLACWNLLGYHY